MHSRILTLLAVPILALALSACQRSDAPPAAPAQQASNPAPSAAWDEFILGFMETHFAAHPAQAVVAGRHDFDGRLPDWSRAGIEKEIARLKQAQGFARSLRAETLTPTQQYQREYFLATTDRLLFWLEKAEWPFRSPTFYFDWMLDSLDPAPYVTKEYAPAAQRMQAFNAYLKALPTAAAQIRDNLRMPMPRTYLNYGVNAFQGLADYLATDAPTIWAGVQDAALQEEFAGANAAAVTAMSELASWLASNRDTATEDYALGAELYRQMLYDTERVDISLEELEAVARADMARNQKALAAACAEFAPGASIRDCFARMASRKPEGSSVEAARRQLDELKAFMVERDLVSIPGTEVALVEESPPYARWNFAYINTAGPYETDMPSVYYIAPPDPSWPEQVQRDYIPGEADLLFTSLHEVWPGHFLNFLHANRSDWLFGRVFVGYAFAEGWAHYTEEMMMADGLRGGSAETRIGQLSNALLRNARFLSSIGLHTQGMSVEESKRLFIEEAHQSEGIAIQQSARGTYDPAYLNYTLGKLMILQLREDWAASRGGRKAWKEFHDTFLSYGGPPVPLVRAQMLGGDPASVFYREQ